MVNVGTRASALALWQTHHVIALWRELEPSLAVTVVELASAGDDAPDAALDTMGGTGLFTSTLERALLEGRIDAAVHSLKDLPVASTPGVAIAAIPPRGPAEDVLCARDGATLAELPARARIGTSSPRRAAQLRGLRMDLEHRPLRGNVPTRLERVRRGDLDAAVLARAGVERLGLGAHISEAFPVERLLPAPSQGALAVQVRADDSRLLESLRCLDDEATRRAVTAEREVLRRLRGGCSVPVGAHARAEGDGLVLEAGVFALDGGRRARASVSGSEPLTVAAAAVDALLACGAAEILDDIARRPLPLSESRP